MKLSNPKIDKPLGQEILDQVQKELKVRFGKCGGPGYCLNGKEQHGVYDEDDQFAGNIMSSGDYFTREELVRETKALFGVTD